MFQQYVNKNVENGAVIYAQSLEESLDFEEVEYEIYQKSKITKIQVEPRSDIYPIEDGLKFLLNLEIAGKVDSGDFIVFEKTPVKTTIGFVGLAYTVDKQTFEENYEPLPVKGAADECAAPKDDSLERGDTYIVEYKHAEQAIPSEKRLTYITDTLSDEHGITFMSAGKLKWFVRYEHLIAFGLAEKGVAK